VLPAPGSDLGNTDLHSDRAIPFETQPIPAATPNQFPSMMASALTVEDLRSWAAEEDVALMLNLAHSWHTGVPKKPAEPSFSTDYQSVGPKPASDS